MFDISTSVNEQMSQPKTSLSLLPLLERLTPYRDLVALLPASQGRRLLCEFSCMLADRTATSTTSSTASTISVSGYDCMQSGLLLSHLLTYSLTHSLLTYLLIMFAYLPCRALRVHSTQVRAE